MSAPDATLAPEEAMAALRADLASEQDSLDALAADLTPAAWRTPTPSPGWSVTDQVAHLAYFDRAAARALSDPDAFARDLAALLEGSQEVGVDEYTLAPLRALGPDGLLAAAREARHELLAAAHGLAATARVPWYGPAMGARSFLSARLMETWAHGTDVADALGVTRPATDRLRHVARLGVNTRDWSYLVRGETPPTGTVRVELLAPSGARWAWGPEDAEDVVAGDALEFCLVVTQRRHVDDTSLRAGPLGRDWLVRAQAFAGAPSEGPAPRRAS